VPENTEISGCKKRKIRTDKLCPESPTAAAGNDMVGSIRKLADANEGGDEEDGE